MTLNDLLEILPSGSEGAYIISIPPGKSQPLSDTLAVAPTKLSGGYYETERGVLYIWVDHRSDKINYVVAADRYADFKTLAKAERKRRRKAAKRLELRA